MSAKTLYVSRMHRNTDRSQVGILTMGNGRKLFSLELSTNLFNKIWPYKCIELGSHKVKNTYSPAFKRTLPLIICRIEGARFHGGNKPIHSKGCTLIGYEAFNSASDPKTFGIRNCDGAMRELISYIGRDTVICTFREDFMNDVLYPFPVQSGVFSVSFKGDNNGKLTTIK